MGKWTDEARRMKPYIQKGVQSLTDQEASFVPTLYGGMAYDGSLIESGTKINWKGSLKRAAVDLWDTEDNNPDRAPDLWEDILYRDGIRIIPESITAGTFFVKDELGWWGDDLYKSVYDGQNIWTPEQYPAGWELQEVIE